jgi:hypothetical protein
MLTSLKTSTGAAPTRPQPNRNSIAKQSVHTQCTLLLPSQPQYCSRISPGLGLHRWSLQCSAHPASPIPPTPLPPAAWVVPLGMVARPHHLAAAGGTRGRCEAGGGPCCYPRIGQLLATGQGSHIAWPGAGR